MSVTTSRITVADEENGVLAVQTSKGDGIELKAVQDENGETRDMIEGYVATTHLDQTNDMFTSEALENMAAQIREDADATVDAVFPEMDGMEESQIGNINHNNNPAAERIMGVGDTRTVPVFKTVHAETRVMTDGETGLYIRGEMLPLPDDLEDAVKGQIRQGGLHSFSVEFSPTEVNFEVGPNGEPQRTIMEAKVNGSALTGRPMNEYAEVTDAELKNILGGKTMTDNEGNTEPEEQPSEEVKGEDYEDEETKQEDDNPCEAGYVQRGMKPNPDGEGEVPNCIPEDEAKMEDGENEDEEMKNDASEEEEEEEDVDETESESEEESDEEDASDSVELKNDVKELKSMFRDIKDENEKLKDENEELKSKLDDFKTIKEIKSEITQLKNAVESSEEDLEGDRPEAEEDQSREVKSEHGEKEQWKNVVDQLGMDEEDLKRQIGSKGMTEAESIAETHGVKKEEVIEYAK